MWMTMLLSTAGSLADAEVFEYFIDHVFLTGLPRDRAQRLPRLPARRRRAGRREVRPVPSRGRGRSPSSPVSAIGRAVRSPKKLTVAAPCFGKRRGEERVLPRLARPRPSLPRSTARPPAAQATETFGLFHRRGKDRICLTARSTVYLSGRSCGVFLSNDVRSAASTTKISRSAASIGGAGAIHADPLDRVGGDREARPCTINRNERPFRTRRSSSVSRVLSRGASATIAPSLPARRFKSEDLPAFGAPKMAVVTPSRMCRASCAEDKSASISSDSAGSSLTQETPRFFIEILVGIIRRRVDFRKQHRKPFLKILDLFSQCAGQLRLRGALRKLGVRADRVHHGLGLRQIDPPVFERASREFGPVRQCARRVQSTRARASVRRRAARRRRAISATFSRRV